MPIFNVDMVCLFTICRCGERRVSFRWVRRESRWALWISFLSLRISPCQISMPRCVCPCRDSMGLGGGEGNGCVTFCFRSKGMQLLQRESIDSNRSHPNWTSGIRSPFMITFAPKDDNESVRFLSYTSLLSKVYMKVSEPCSFIQPITLALPRLLKLWSRWIPKKDR